MRLVNVDTLIDADTLTLREFNELNVPTYAILSHTWVDGQEVLYSEVLHPTPKTRSKSGYAKIRGCAREARRLELDWIWVDTCCIDKSSSSELSEAINSMYVYYKYSQVCFAYLADTALSEHSRAVSLTPRTRHGALEGADSTIDTEHIFECIKGSRWWTRGWTLQELIAPQNLAFYSSNWTFICDKILVANQISAYTNIVLGVLEGQDPSTAGIAQRMSWASRRETTRTEDLAYCLLGIFDVNMPLLYGEGKKAFIRLQEEIIRYSTDQSIFAWTFATVEDPFSYFSGVLASSPKAFSHCGSTIPFEAGRSVPSLKAYSITNVGLNISVPIQGSEGRYVASLACAQLEGRCTIQLEELEENVFVRVPEAPAQVPLRTYQDSIQPEIRPIIIVHKTFPSSIYKMLHRTYGFSFKSIAFPGIEPQFGHRTHSNLNLQQRTGIEGRKLTILFQTGAERGILNQSNANFLSTLAVAPRPIPTDGSTWAVAAFPLLEITGLNIGWHVLSFRVIGNSSRDEIEIVERFIPTVRDGQLPAKIVDPWSDSANLFFHSSKDVVIGDITIYPGETITWISDIQRRSAVVSLLIEEDMKINELRLSSLDKDRIKHLKENICTVGSIGVRCRGLILEGRLFIQVDICTSAYGIPLA